MGSGDEVAGGSRSEEAGEESSEEAGGKMQVVREPGGESRDSQVEREEGEVQVGSRGTTLSGEEGA